MATVRPFAALRPKPELAAQICELPYDVLSSNDARAVAAGNPLSFLRVSKPEIDLPPGTHIYSPQVYAKGQENFRRLITQGAMHRDAQPCFYLYRQIMAGHSQIGLVAAASCEEYLRGVVKKHELTRPDKEDDRVRHIESLSSQTGPVFLVHRARPRVDEFIAGESAKAPAIDFTARDGIQHTAWIISGAEGIRFIEAEFAHVPCLYIADGHHRCAAASRVYLARSASIPVGDAGAALDTAAFFLSVIFPHNQVRILPYNRVLKDLNGLSATKLLEKLDGVFIINAAKPAALEHESEASFLNDESLSHVRQEFVTARKHELGLFLEGRWHTLNFRPRFAATTDPIEKLDVTLLQKYVLDPIFGIDDPRTSQRIHFVGGIRGAAELERLVASGEYACAFSMFPTGIEDLMSVADAGGIMPPKSTWFEPKLRDAMFCHMI
jgi:uncharacterized protein (DUF1015 family)